MFIRLALILACFYASAFSLWADEGEDGGANEPPCVENDPVNEGDPEGPNGGVYDGDLAIDEDEVVIAVGEGAAAPLSGSSSFSDLTFWIPYDYKCPNPTGEEGRDETATSYDPDVEVEDSEGSDIGGMTFDTPGIYSFTVNAVATATVEGYSNPTPKDIGSFDVRAVGVADVSGEGVTSTTDSPGDDETIYVAVSDGESGGTITITASSAPSGDEGGSSWPAGEPSWSGVEVGEGEGSSSSVDFPIDVISADEDGTTVTASCGTSSKAMKVVVVGVATVEGEGVVSATDSPGEDETIFVERGLSGDTITLSAYPQPISTWSDALSLLTWSSNVTDNEDGSASYNIDSLTSSEGDTVTATVGSKSVSIKIIVFEFGDLQAGTEEEGVIIPAALVSGESSSVRILSEIQPTGIDYPEDSGFQRKRSSNEGWEDGPDLADDTTWDWTGGGTWQVRMNLAGKFSEPVEIFVVDAVTVSTPFEEDVGDWIVKGVHSVYGTISLKGDDETATDSVADYFSVDVEAPDLNLDSEGLTFTDGEIIVTFDTSEVVGSSGVDTSTLEATVSLVDNSISKTFKFTATVLSQILGLNTLNWKPSETAELEVVFSPELASATQETLDAVNSLLSGLEVFDSTENSLDFGTITVANGLPSLTIGVDGTFDVGDAKIRVSQESDLYQSYQNFQDFEQAYTIVTAYAKELDTIALFNPHATYSGHSGPVEYELVVTPKNATLTFNSTEISKESDSLTTQPQRAYLEAITETVTEEGLTDFTVEFESEFEGKIHSAEAVFKVEKTSTYELANGDSSSLSEQIHQELTVGIESDLGLHADALGLTLNQTTTWIDKFTESFNDKTSSVATEVSVALGAAASETGVEKYSIDLGYAYEYTSMLGSGSESVSRTWGVVLNGGVDWDDTEAETAVSITYNDQTLIFSNEGLNGALNLSAEVGYDFDIFNPEFGNGGIDYAFSVEINISW